MTILTTETQAIAARVTSVEPRFFSLKRFTTPLVVIGVLLLLLLWLSILQLDSIEQRTLNWNYIILRIGEHISLTVVASVLVAIIAIPIGVAVAKSPSRIFRAIVLMLANIGQATPAVGIIILLAIIWQTGYITALVALIIYVFLPVLRNTMIGIEQVDSSVCESAKGMGMTVFQILFRIELPLAVPVILAGLRTALVFCVGVATIATFINAGGLGDMIINGLKLQRYPVLLSGAVLVACLALLTDWVAGFVEDLLTPKVL